MFPLSLILRIKAYQSHYVALDSIESLIHSFFLFDLFLTDAKTKILKFYLYPSKNNTIFLNTFYEDENYFKTNAYTINPKIRKLKFVIPSKNTT